jgi:hypothetical protein
VEPHLLPLQTLVSLRIEKATSRAAASRTAELIRISERKAEAAQRDDDAALEFQEANPLPSVNPLGLKSTLKKIEAAPLNGRNVRFYRNVARVDAPFLFKDQDFHPPKERRKAEREARDEVEAQERRQRARVTSAKLPPTMRWQASGLYGQRDKQRSSRRTDIGTGKENTSPRMPSRRVTEESKGEKDKKPSARRANTGAGKENISPRMPSRRVTEVSNRKMDKRPNARQADILSSPRTLPSADTLPRMPSRRVRDKNNREINLIDKQPSARILSSPRPLQSDSRMPNDNNGPPKMPSRERKTVDDGKPKTSAADGKGFNVADMKAFVTSAKNAIHAIS